MLNLLSPSFICDNKASFSYFYTTQIAQTAGGESINFELQQTLETIKSEMNINELPDISKLSLDDLNDNDDEKDINKNNDNDKLDIDSFLEDDEDDDDDVDLIEDKMNVKNKLYFK